MSFLVVRFRFSLCIGFLLFLLQGCLTTPKARSSHDEMVYVRGGTFEMGAKEETYFTQRQRPLHHVHVQSFHINRTEITNKTFCHYLNAIKHRLRIERHDVVSKESVALKLGKNIICDVKGDDASEFECGIEMVMDRDQISAFEIVDGYEEFPVIYVTWYGAQAFCRWSYKKGSLPSEAQWEYAAKGGHHLDQHSLLFSGSDTLDKVGWYWDNSDFAVKQVALKQANALGIHDMSGNLWEWVQDHWHEDYVGAPAHGKPWIDRRSSRDRNRVLRGGAWLYHASNAKVTSRWNDVPDDRHKYKGFRCVCY